MKGVSVADAKGLCLPLLEERLAGASLLTSEQKPEPSQHFWHHQDRQLGAGPLPDPCLSWHCPWGYCGISQEFAASLPWPGR